MSANICGGLIFGIPIIGAIHVSIVIASVATMPPKIAFLCVFIIENLFNLKILKINWHIFN